MIIRFDNLDDVYYSGQYVFDQNGFHHANYDYTTIDESVDLTDILSCDVNRLDKILFGFLPTKPFAYTVSDLGYTSHYWTSFKIVSGDVFLGYFQYLTVDPDDCFHHPDVNYSFSGNFNSWTSSNICNIKRLSGINPDDGSYIYYDEFFKYRDSDCYYFYPVLGFKNLLDYPRFKIYAKDFSNYPSFNCKFNLFLHFFYLVGDVSSCNFRLSKTLKIGSFCCVDNNLYFENFYGERVLLNSSDKPYFDLTNFFNTVVNEKKSSNGNVSVKDDYLYNSVSDLPIFNLNAFGYCFAFEIKEEADFGAMSGLDCQCLTNAINSLNNTLESLFKIEDNNICDIFVNTMAECFGVGSYPDDFKGIGQLFSNTFLRGNNLDKSVFRTLLDIDFADSFSSAFNLLSGAGSVFTNNAINPANYRSIYDDFHDSFYNGDCGSWLIQSFNEAFNLTNCQGSVFKANDNIWNDEDSLAGIWYKQLDYDYVLSHANSHKSNFWVSEFRNNSYRIFSSAYLLSKAFFVGFLSDGTSSSTFNLQNFGSGVKFAEMFKRAFFIGSNSGVNTTDAGNSRSVFYFDNDVFKNNKILNHSCDVNPNSIKFCESVSQPAIPVEISSPVQIFQPEDEFGEPVPFKMDWKPLLDLLSEALFCQFGNQDLDPRHSWGYSVFNKLLYPLHPEGCDDKVGLPELDFSEGFVPDNIFVNSNGLIARFNSEIYK